MSGLSKKIVALAVAGLAGSLLRGIGGPSPVDRVLAGTRRSGLTSGYKDGPGWSVAQAKRMAKKARNQRRHKQACKGVRHGKH